MRLADFREIDLARIIPTMQCRRPRIHHHRNEAATRGIRHRPRPAIRIRLDECVRGVRHVERRVRLPETNQRHGPEARLETTQTTITREKACAARTVERERRALTIISAGASVFDLGAYVTG